MSRPVFDYFVFNGKNCMDYNVKISAADYGSAERDVETVEIPGRNGDLVIDRGRFKNRELRYPAYITADFRVSLAALINFLQSDPGYHRIEDTYHPEIFMMARYSGPFDPENVSFNEAGDFILRFDRKPQKWLKSGETAISVSTTESTSIFNPTYFDALPLIRVYGYGTLTIGDYTITVAEGATEYIDIDSDIMDCFEGSINRNSLVTLDEFPKLVSGRNEITISGNITRVDITPRWWKV